MRGVMKLAAVKRSTPAMAEALPELPMPGTVMVRLVRILGSAVTDYFDPAFRRTGLSESAFHVLCLLLAAENEQASPGDLAELMGASKANVSRILDQLVREKLVSRRTEPADARRHVIQITSKGRNMANRVVPQLKAPLAQAFSGLEPEEFEMLTKLMEKAILSLDTGGIALKPEQKRKSPGRELVP